MLLKLSKLTGDVEHHDRHYINTRMIALVGPVDDDPDNTRIIMHDGSSTFAEKPVEEVVDILKEHDRSLAV